VNYPALGEPELDAHLVCPGQPVRRTLVINLGQPPISKAIGATLEVGEPLPPHGGLPDHQAWADQLLGWPDTTK